MTLTVAPKTGAVARLPVLMEMVSPAASVRLSVLLFKEPEVKVSVPPLVSESGLPSATPPALFMVRFSNPEVTAGSVRALLPLQAIPEVEPPVNEPLAIEIEPFSVRVWAPIESTPLVNVSAPLTVPEPPKRHCRRC